MPACGMYITGEEQMDFDNPEVVLGMYITKLTLYPSGDRDFFFSLFDLENIGFDDICTFRHMQIIKICQV